MVSLNKIFSFKIKGQAKNVFPNDVDRTVDNDAHECSQFSDTPVIKKNAKRNTKENKGEMRLLLRLSILLE